MKTVKKAFATILVLAILFNLAACGKPSITASSIKDKASEIGNEISETASNLIDSAGEFFSNISLPDFKRGYEITAGYFNATLASIEGAVYVENVASAISDLQKRITSRVSSNGSVESQAGYVAEEWHAGTYNIDAVARGSGKRADTPKSNGLGSADITVGDDLSASAKYYKTASESAKQQAKNYLERYAEYKNKTNNPKQIEEWLQDNGISFSEEQDLYYAVLQDQLRIIPADQLEEARKILEQAIKKEEAKSGGNRKYVAETDLETLKNLSDRLKTADGTESIPLEKADAEALVKAARDNNLSAEKLGELGASLNTSVTGGYIAKQALKSGATAAIIEAALILGPEIYELIRLAIEDGEIDEARLKEVGFDGLDAAGDGFLKGSISNALVIMCQAGKLGTAFVNASPALIGTLTVLIIDAIRYGIMMGNGKLSISEYTDIMAEEVFVSAGVLGTTALIGLLIPGSALAIMLGGFIGGLILSVGYSYGKPFVLALIEDNEINLMVHIEEKANIIKDAAAFVSVKLSDALSSLKKVSTDAYEKVTIKLYDLSTSITTP